MKIEDHYYTFINGGWSSNSHVYLLIAEFAELNSFTSLNGVIYDEYANWQRLVSSFVKGLFASHAMRGTSNSALQSFDDYLLSIMILYGDAESISKYFYRYKVKYLAYERSSQNNDFIYLAFNILNDHSSTMNIVLEGRNPNTRYASKVQKMTNNLITIASFLADNAFDINEFAERTLPFFKNKSHHYNCEKVLTRFLARKSNLFNEKVARKYITFLIDNIETIGLEPLTILLDRRKKISLGKKRIIKIVKNVLLEPNCHDGNHYTILIAIYQKSTVAKQYLIVEMIKNKLDEGFDFDLYYNTLIHGLIPFEEEEFYSELGKIDFKTQEYSVESIFTQKNNEYFSRLDKLLNVAFKYNVVLRKSSISKIKKVGQYYNWLMNMENFDYSNFKIEWLNHYPTDFYLQKMSKSIKLRQVVSELLKTNRDTSIEKFLVRLFTRQNKTEE